MHAPQMVERARRHLGWLAPIVFLLSSSCGSPNDSNSTSYAAALPSASDRAQPASKVSTNDEAAGRSEATSEKPASVVELIDDLENGPPYIARTNGRSGYWYVRNDDPSGTSTSSVFEAPGHESSSAVHLFGADFVKENPSVGFLFAGEPGQTYDASRYSGFHFWAKGSAADAGQGLTVAFGDRDTLPEFGHCVVNHDGAAHECGSFFHTDIALFDHWCLYTVKFDELRQPNGGYHPPSFATSGLYSMFFYVQHGTFDFWVDDIAFIR
jgi:hypothetical protein